MGCIVKSHNLKVKSHFYENVDEGIISANINITKKIHPKMVEGSSFNSKVKILPSSSLKPYKLLIKKTQNFSFVPKEDYSKKLQSKTWTTVFDFLTFKELYEVGKVNSLFNSITKNGNILKKFFNKNKIYSTDKNKNFNKIMNEAILVNISVHRKNDNNFSGN